MPVRHHPVPRSHRPVARSASSPKTRRIRGLTVVATAALALAVTACSSSRPAGLHQAGALDTGCTLTYTDGVADGATISLYNPGSGSVVVSQLGVEQISNGVLMGTAAVPDPSLPLTIGPGAQSQVPVTFGSASSATSCQAGWS